MSYDEKLIKELEELKVILADDSSKVSDIFNHNLQSSFKKSNIKRIAFKERIAQKFLGPTLLRIPFDPFTGKATETYNERTPWVRLKKPADIFRLILLECDKNSELKKTYIRHAKYKGEWDTSSPDNIFSEASRAILWEYRQPLIYTFPALTINLEAISGRSFPQQFLLDTRQNPLTGEFEGELSLMHTLGMLNSMAAQNECKSFNQAITDASSDTLSKKLKRSFTHDPNYMADITDIECQVAMDRRREIRQSYPTSGPRPICAMVLLGFEVAPVTGYVTQQVSGGKYELMNDFIQEEIDFAKHLYFTDKFKAREMAYNIMGNKFAVDPTDLVQRDGATDLYINFFVFDYITDDKRENMTKDERKEASVNTKFASEKKPLFDVVRNEYQFSGLEHFIENSAKFYEYVDSNNLVSSIQAYIAESYSPVTDDMTNKALEIMSERYAFNSPIYTDAIKMTCKDVLQEMFPDEYSQEIAKMIDEGKADVMPDMVDEMIREQEALVRATNSVAKDISETEEEDDEYGTIDE